MLAAPIIAQASTTDAAAGAAAGLAVLSLVFMIVGLILAITWIVFPFIVISKCNQIARISRESCDELEAIRRELAAALERTPPLPAAAAADPPERV